MSFLSDLPTTLKYSLPLAKWGRTHADKIIERSEFRCAVDLFPLDFVIGEFFEHWRAEISIDGVDLTVHDWIWDIITSVDSEDFACFQVYCRIPLADEERTPEVLRILNDEMPKRILCYGDEPSAYGFAFTYKRAAIQFAHQLFSFERDDRWFGCRLEIEPQCTFHKDHAEYKFGNELHDEFCRDLELHNLRTDAPLTTYGKVMHAGRTKGTEKTKADGHKRTDMIRDLFHRAVTEEPGCKKSYYIARILETTERKRGKMRVKGEKTIRNALEKYPPYMAL